jgi:hypothetical protein
VRDCVIVPLIFVNREIVIAFGNLQTRKWAVIDFALESWIRSISLFQDQELVIRNLISTRFLCGELAF